LQAYCFTSSGSESVVGLQPELYFLSSDTIKLVHVIPSIFGALLHKYSSLQALEEFSSSSSMQT
jgi:hypothetical protein